MPTFTAVALDRLLEPRSRSAAAAPPPPPPPARQGSERKRIPLLPASPALYATPEATPLPDSPSSFPPSPYIINHKRRGPRLLKTLSHTDVGIGVGLPPPPPPIATTRNGTRELGLEDKAVEDQNGFHEKKIDDGGSGRGGVEAEELVKNVDAVELKNDGEGDDFFDPHETMSTASNDSCSPARLGKAGTPLGEFYDAMEEISSGGTTRSSRNIEDELREMRLNVLMEIERRMHAEEALENLQNQWQRLSHHLSQVGLILPSRTITEEIDGQKIPDPAEDLCQQVIVARSVAKSIARGCSRAEAELEMEPQIESKNFEIARLWDRLQYYETANREMSQRNQEAVEMARQHRHKRKRRKKWFWSTVGFTITLGSAALAWSYLPHSKPPCANEGDSSATDVN